MDGEKQKILIVDDDSGSLKLLQAILTHEGYDVIKAFDGDEALGLIEGDNGVELVISDVMMPRLNGFDLVKRLRDKEQTRLIPVILVTGLKGKEDKIKGIDAGCDDFIAKPFDAEEVKSRVRALLKISFYRSMLDEKEKLEHVMDAIETGIILLDQDLHVTRINQKVREWFDCGARELPQDLGVFFQEQYHLTCEGKLPDDLKVNAMTFVLERQESLTVKPLILEARSTLIRNKLGELTTVLIMINDVTLAKREAMKKEAFLTLVTHKVMTPMAVMIGNLEGLKDGIGGSLSERQAAMVATSLKRIMEYKEMMRKVLEYSELSQKKMFVAKKPSKVLALIERNVESVSQNFPQKKMLPKIQCDPDIETLLEPWYWNLILANLLENSCKFTEGNEVEVEITAQENGADIMMLAVRDKGLGIPVEERHKIFDSFYQIEKYSTGQVPGFGLGLAIVKYLVEARAGGIEVNSQLNAGTTFSITLPN